MTRVFEKKKETYLLTSHNTNERVWQARIKIYKNKKKKM